MSASRWNRNLPCASSPRATQRCTIYSRRAGCHSGDCPRAEAGRQAHLVAGPPMDAMGAVVLPSLFAAHPRTSPLRPTVPGITASARLSGRTARPHQVTGAGGQCTPRPEVWTLSEYTSIDSLCRPSGLLSRSPECLTTPLRGDHSLGQSQSSPAPRVGRDVESLARSARPAQWCIAPDVA
jgi:hypothetical protein